MESNNLGMGQLAGVIGESNIEEVAAGASDRRSCSAPEANINIAN